ncbi:hypothetical protein Fcan01_10212 [Folsomia candida]|uniref:DDE Tnp4 domain-containing protein n=1 Tax=Folsomia candida TaxID=158441 RepID=A0A226EBT7_FOLCA|nr:hypothetical protein Fcan01_10212 [Folsomia candida]
MISPYFWGQNLFGAEKSYFHHYSSLRRIRYDFRFYTDFRFIKEEILNLINVLRIPKEMRTPQGLKFLGAEGFCILLRRLAYPNRLLDLQPIFGRREEELSHIFNTVLDYIYDNFRWLTESWKQWWLQVDHLKAYSDAITAKGSALQTCFGFIDGTLHATCRPTRHQQEVYSGHKRQHGLKYQSVVLPNGLIANLYGPVSGRRHDSYMLAESNLMWNLQNHLGAENLHLYGDKGYALQQHLITPYQGNDLPPQHRQFNLVISRMRICVEWEFGELFEQFAFLDLKKNQKIYLQPLGKYMAVATILKNCKTCLNGSQTSMYFGLNPPSLSSYVNNDPNL